MPCEVIYLNFAAPYLSADLAATLHFSQKSTTTQHGLSRQVGHYWSVLYYKSLIGLNSNLLHGKAEQQIINTKNGRCSQNRIIEFSTKLLKTKRFFPTKL